MATTVVPTISGVTNADAEVNGSAHSAQPTSGHLTGSNGKRPAIGVNIGCGATPTPGWVNFDNSPVVRLARFGRLLSVTGLLSRERLHFLRAARELNIRWANAAVFIPLPDESVRVVYSCGMPILLDPNTEMPRFLAEARRVLVHGGIIRLAVDDLLQAARNYVLHAGDADAFVSSLHVMRGIPQGRMACARNLFVGYRGSRWIYDAASLASLLEKHGFRAARELPPGKSLIPDPGTLNLREREDEKYIYVEAVRE